MRAGDLHLTGERLEQLIRWHGTDETNLPHPDTLRNLSRDTIAALRELAIARARIFELRAAMGRAFGAPDFREAHEILLGSLGPPPPLDEEALQLENSALASSAQNTAST